MNVVINTMMSHQVRKAPQEASLQDPPPIVTPILCVPVESPSRHEMHVRLLRPLTHVTDAAALTHHHPLILRCCGGCCVECRREQGRHHGMGSEEAELIRSLTYDF